MNWKEYSQLALRTEAIPSIQYLNMPGLANDNFDMNEEREINTAIFARATRLLHAAMGLVTETDELEDHTDRVNLIEEIGDCFWYLPIIESIVPELDLAFVIYARLNAGTAENSLRACRRYAAELVDIVGKRHIIYGKPLHIDKLREAATSYGYYLVRYCANRNISLEDCWEANIKKLEKRYPKLRFDGDDAVNRNVANELSHIEVAEDLKTKDVAYVEEAVVSMDDQIKFRWDALKAGIGVDLVYNSPPAEVARKVLDHLNCTEDYAKALLGDEFTRCRFTVAPDESRADEFGDFWILTAVPFEEKQVEASPQELLDAKGFAKVLRRDFTPNQIERFAIGLAYELGDHYRRLNMPVLASAIGGVYREYTGRGDVLVDSTLFGMYTMLGYVPAVEAVLCIVQSIIKEPCNASNNSSAG